MYLNEWMRLDLISHHKIGSPWSMTLYTCSSRVNVLERVDKYTLFKSLIYAILELYTFSSRV